MHERFTPIPDIACWSQSIGGLIINFGSLEFQTLRWLERLSSQDVFGAIRGCMLNQRVNAILELISKSSISEPIQLKARALWAEVMELANVRNRIAHNPLALGRDPESGEAVFSVIDLKKMVPVGENRLEPLSHIKIAEVAVRAAEVSHELSAIIEAMV